MEERRLGKLEATLGLSIIVALLVALGFAYIYQLDSPVKVTPPDPNWASAQMRQPGESPVERTAYRPEWLSSQQDDGREVFR
jgi:hypothetical protein